MENNDLCALTPWQPRLDPVLQRHSFLCLFGGARQDASVLHILSKTEAYVFAFQLPFIIKYFQSLRGY